MPNIFPNQPHHNKFNGKVKGIWGGIMKTLNESRIQIFNFLAQLPNLQSSKLGKFLSPLSLHSEFELVFDLLSSQRLIFRLPENPVTPPGFSRIVQVDQKLSYSVVTSLLLLINITVGVFMTAIKLKACNLVVVPLYNSSS